MVAAMNRIMVFVGVTTLFQAVGQMILTSLALFQYFCIIDFLVELPLFVFIRILYFHNPSTCGFRINIGESINGMADQAFVLLTREPFTVTRTFIINSISLGLSVVWLLSCVGLMRGGVNNKQTKPVRWPWIIVTIAVCGLDTVATVTYANDTFHTRTLSDMMDFIGGITSGTGNQEVDTSWAAWLMVIFYSRFVILFILNLIFIVLVVIDGSKRLSESTAVQVEAPTFTIMDMYSDKDAEDEVRLSRQAVATILPRPGLRESFRRIKSRLFREPYIARCATLPNSLDPSPERRRGTAAQLQGQLPWAYIPASGHLMRDQPDEDLPPIPLPDYTAISSFRKASVHRATSSLSSFTQKNYRPMVPLRKYKSPLTQSDVLY